MTNRTAAPGGGGGLVVGTTAITGGAAFALLREDASQNLAADSTLTFGSAAAGTGLAIVAGTATTDVAALSVTRTNNNAAVATGVKIAFTDTLSAAGFLPFQVLGDTTGAVNLLKVDKNGQTSTQSLSVVGLSMLVGGAQDSSGGYWKITGASANTLKFASSSTLVWAATDANNGTTDAGVSRLGAASFGIGNGTGGSFAGSLKLTTLSVNGNGTSLGAASSSDVVVKSVTGIVNAAATATFTVTVPNAAHSASIRVRLTGSLGAGGAIGANESTQDAEYMINVARTAGVNAVTTIGAVVGQAAAASVAGANNAAVTGTLSAVSGAVGSANTFTINVTITKSGGASASHTCLAFAELLNANASGVTIA